mgnify:FL=1
MMLRDKKRKLNKKGVSVIIGYVLLIAFAILISAGVYAWLKTYVPREPLNCPDGVSIFVKEAGFNSSTGQLIVTVRNNGRFNTAGYFIYVSNNSAQKNPSIEISNYLQEDEQTVKFGNSVLLSLTGDNSFSPGDERINVFNLSTGMGELFSIRIIPTRFQEEENKKRFVSCGNAGVQQIIGEPGMCTSQCTGKVCGNDGCGGSCGSCGTGFSCDALGQCYSNSCTPASDPTLRGVCGTFVCGTKTNGTCGSADCGTCSTNSTCNVTAGTCVANCGNGIIDVGEQCDGTNLSGQNCTTQGFTSGTLSCSSTTCQFNTASCTTTIGNGVCNAGETCAQEPVACQGLQATCSSGNVCVSGSCQPTNGGVGCTNYCISLLHNPPYTDSVCTSNTGQCGSNGGTVQSGGNTICTQRNSQLPVCCCFT